MNTEELKTFVRLFDAAITSDNPSVKKALKNLMIISTFVNTETHNKIGPLESAITDIEALRQRVSSLEITVNSGTAQYYEKPYMAYPIQVTAPHSTLPDHTVLDAAIGNFFYNTTPRKGII